jgi:hypothetical protein
MKLVSVLIRSIILTAAALSWVPSPAAAHDQKLKPTAGGIGVADKPLNCEMTLQLMEDVRDLIKAQGGENNVMILIARLGSREKSRSLNRRRLLNVREGLRGTLGVVEPIVIAEGERVNGFGRVEVYIGGKFVGALLARRNSHVIKCEW